MGLVWLGVLLGCSASAFQSLGQCVQKLAHAMQQPAPTSSTGSGSPSLTDFASHIAAGGVSPAAGAALPGGRQQSVWLMGVALFLGGALLAGDLPTPISAQSTQPPLSSARGVECCRSGASMFFAAQILASPLQALILVFNPIFARFILGEAIPARVVAGVVLVLAGMGLTVGFGPTTNEDSEDVHTLLRRAYATQFLVVASSTVVVFICLCVVAKRIERKGAVCPDLSNCSSRWLCCCYTTNNGIVSGSQFLAAK